MRKKGILCGSAALIVAAVAAWNLGIGFKSDSVLSDIALANVEALANNEENKNNGYRSTNSICVLDHVIYYKCTYDGRDLYHCTCPC